MSNKRKLPIILGTCAATVFAAGGSIFLTDTALSLLDRRTQNVREADTEQGLRETELPITVEQFAKTGDSFKIVPGEEPEQAETSGAETEGQTEEDADQSEQKESETDESSYGETESGASQTGGSASQTESGATQTGGSTSQTESGATQTGGSASQTESGTSQTEETTPQTEVERVTPGTMYARSDVYVRSSAGTDGEILGVVSEGNGIMATGKKLGNWIEVNYDGKTAYVGGSYLTTENVNGTGSSSGGTGSAGGSSGSTGSAGGSSGGTSNAGGSSGGTGSAGSSFGSTGSTGSSSGGTGSTGGSASAVIPVNGTMYATAGVNVRTGPGSGYDRLGAISAGESIGVTGDTEDGWTEVVYDGQRGYIYSSYLVGDPDDISSGNSGDSGSSDDSDGSGAQDGSYIYDVSSYYCDESEFDGWSATDLAYLRNEIFARHGRIFTTEKYRDYFSKKTWYNPTYDPSYFDDNLDSFLNDYEWANLKLIQRLEDERY